MPTQFDPWQEAPAWAFEVRDTLALVLQKVELGSSRTDQALANILAKAELSSAQAAQALANILAKVELGSAQTAQSIAKLEAEMATDFSALEAEVARNTSVDESAAVLLAGLTEEIKKLREGADAATQAKIDALVSKLDGSNDALAAAVAANTPTEPTPEEPPPA